MPTALRGPLVAELLVEAAEGVLDLSGLWIAQRRGRIVGALLTQGLAGRAAAIWAPEVTLAWGRAETARALLRAAIDDLARRGYRLVQALLDPTAPHRAAIDLTRAGVPRITELVYLDRATAEALPLDPSVPRFDWQSFSPATEAEFRAVLDATYIGSLDMPELDGLRALEDVLASHQATGRFEPARWQLGRLPGEPAAAAVVLLAESAGRDVWEVAYLGLTPPARGRRLGLAALARALDLARPHVARLELAVDIRNAPALRLYETAGFIPFDRRAVHMAILNQRSLPPAHPP
jgi:mycothiol synthase